MILFDAPKPSLSIHPRKPIAATFFYKPFPSLNEENTIIDFHRFKIVLTYQCYFTCIRIRFRL